MTIHSDSGSTGVVTKRGDNQPKGVITLGEHRLVHKAAGAKKAPGVQSVRGDATQFGHNRPRAVVTRQLPFAKVKDTYTAKVVGETVRQRGSTSRPDGTMLPSGPDIFVISMEWHERRVPKGNLKPELRLYLFDKQAYLKDPAVFLGTRLDGEDVVFDLSVPCRGLLAALMLGHINRQTTVYHPASDGFLQVPDSQELSRIAAACSCAERKTLPDALSCVDASLSDLTQDVYIGVLELILVIGSMPPAELTEETLEQLQRICKRASDVGGDYASWFGVARAHAVHQRKAATSEVSSGQEDLQAAV